MNEELEEVESEEERLTRLNSEKSRNIIKEGLLALFNGDHLKVTNCSFDAKWPKDSDSNLEDFTECTFLISFAIKE